MFGFGTLKSAVLKLAGSITDLASTVKDIDVQLRQRAALDGPEPVEALTLASVPAKASGVAQDATSAADTPTTDPAPQAGRNGRKRATAAAATGE